MAVKAMCKYCGKSFWKHFKYSFPVFICNYTEKFDLLNFPLIPWVLATTSYHSDKQSNYIFGKELELVKHTGWNDYERTIRRTEKQAVMTCNSNIPSIFLLRTTKAKAQHNQQVQQLWHQRTVPTTTLQCLADYYTFCIGGKTWSFIHEP